MERFQKLEAGYRHRRLLAVRSCWSAARAAPPMPRPRTRTRIICHVTDCPLHHGYLPYLTLSAGKPGIRFGRSAEPRGMTHGCAQARERSQRTWGSIPAFLCRSWREQSDTQIGCHTMLDARSNSSTNAATLLAVGTAPAVPEALLPGDSSLYTSSSPVVVEHGMFPKGCPSASFSDRSYRRGNQVYLLKLRR